MAVWNERLPGSGQMKVIADGPFGDASGQCDLLITEFGLVLEAHDLDELLHWNPHCGQSNLLLNKRSGYAAKSLRIPVS